MLSLRINKIGLILQVLISLLAIYIATVNVNFRSVVNSFKGVDYPFILPAISFHLLSLVTKGYLWRKMLRIFSNKVSLGSSLSIFTISLMLNNVFPARLGDLARAYLMGKKEKISSGEVLSTVILERALDLIVVLIFAGLLLRIVPSSPLLRRASFVAFLLGIALALLIYLFKNQNRGIEWISLRFCHLLGRRIGGRLGEVYQEFAGGFESILKRTYLPHFFWISIAYWLLVSGSAYFMLLTFGLHLGFMAPILVTSFTSIGRMVPSTPGALGTYHFFCISSLAVYKVEKSIALTYALALHGAHYLVEVFSGLFFLWREGLRVSNLLNGEKRL